MKGVKNLPLKRYFSVVFVLLFMFVLAQG